MPKLINLGATTLDFDESPKLKITGGYPRQELALLAEMKDDLGHSWSSQAAVVLEKDGDLDLETFHPIAGSYLGQGFEGLLWSMQCLDNSRPSAPFYRTCSKPLELKVTLKDSEQTYGELVFTRRLADSIVCQEKTLEACGQKLVFKCYHHQEVAEQAPLLLFLSSSSWDFEAEAAYVWAQKGFRVVHWPLGLKIDQEKELPIELLQAVHKDLAKESILVATGRAAEYALLSSSLLNLNWKAVAVSGASGLTFLNPHQSVWSYQGEVLPGIELEISSMSGVQPLSTRKLFSDAVKDLTKREKGRIEVEKLQAPLLLLSGQEDQVWPASALSELVVQRLKKLDYPFEVLHQTYESAGHWVGPELGLPLRSTFHLEYQDPDTKITYRFGGKGGYQARANIESWKLLMEFLERHR